ncbi:MAG TPA: hypothetical protein VFR17_10725 [Mycobacterium sp.]|nr:hypothetical protein [Mycobacterium sp.]
MGGIGGIAGIAGIAGMAGVPAPGDGALFRRGAGGAAGAGGASLLAGGGGRTGAVVGMGGVLLGSMVLVVPDGYSPGYSSSSQSSAPRPQAAATRQTASPTDTADRTDFPVLRVLIEFP